MTGQAVTPDQFLTFADPLPEPMLLLTGSGLVLAGNRAVESRTGVAVHEFLGSNLAHFVADSPDDVAHYLRSCSRSRSLVLGSLNLRGKSGENVSCRAEGTLLRPSNGAEEALLLLRIIPKESAVGQFVVLNQRIEDLGREIHRRKSAEAAARQQAEWLRVTLHSIGDAVIVTDAEGRVVLLNSVAQALTAWTPEEAAGAPLLEVFRILNERTRRPVENPALRAIKEGVGVGLANHTILVAKDGTERPIDDSAAPIRDEKGQVLGAVLVFRDVTQRRQAEEQLSRSEQRFARFMQHFPGLAWIKDVQGRYVYANEAAVRAFSTPWADLHGKTDEELFPREVAARFSQNDRQAVASAGGIQVIETLEHEDGTLHYSLVTKFPIQGPGGEVAFVGGMAIDVTEQRRAEVAMRESEKQLRLLADTIPQLAWMARPDGHIFWYNRRWHEYTGTTPEEMEGWGWQAVHDPEMLPVVVDRWTASLSTGESFDMVFPLKGADGRFRHFLTRVNPLKDAQDRILYWFGTNTDISEIKRMEEALRDADRRKDEFLATLAHELRNPLAPIRNSLQILRMPRVDPDIARQTREMMERQVHHLVRLVDDLLDVSRVMRGKIELRRERVELATIVARAVETAKPLIEVQGHTLDLSLPTESLPLDADPVRLAQVLGNLLTNAAKYTEANGNIRLSARRDGAEVALSVRDDGIGIAADMLPHVFELFVQADHTSTKAQGGLGIGLTLVKNLVELHGGSVSADSAGLGTGSEFVVRLPLVVHSDDAPSMDEGLVENFQPSSGRRLLVVDDNRDAAASLGMLLQLQGHEVRVANDGQSALELATSFRPHLVFLDLGMPGMDGFEVARRLRQTPSLEKTTLVALTGWGQREDRRRTAEAGFNHHLVKPPEFEAVEKLLAELDGTCER
jgi:PAS domain S-box-containing protein